MHTHNFNWTTLVMFCLLTVMFLYEAWVNLIRQKVSNFALDAFNVLSSQELELRKQKKMLRHFQETKQKLLWWGFALLPLD